MNRETVKSLILTALIAISLFFTWNIWNLQPPYEDFQNSGFYERIPISQETREPYQVVKPQQLFFHTPNHHYSQHENDEYLQSLWREMQSWVYRNERNLSHLFTEASFQSLIHQEGESMIELRFYDEIPISLFQSMVDWTSDLSGNIVFDRIFLNVVEGTDLQKVYFVSYDNESYIEATITQGKGSQYVAELFEKRDELQVYFPYHPKQGQREVLLPEGNVELNEFHYLTEQIDGEKFRDALFNNPQIVKQDFNFSKNRYTDGTRELNIFPSQHLVRYVNPTLRDSNFIETKTLIEQSINLLNDHGGWTDDFVLYDLQGNEQEVKFIMSIKSIPIIASVENSYGPTTITQRWGQNEIALYERPLYQLLTPPLSSEIDTLMSGRNLVDLIVNYDQIDSSQISNIFIAYELGSADNQLTVKVAPVWCIKMKDGTLIKMSNVEEQSGGDKNGLE